MREKYRETRTKKGGKREREVRKKTEKEQGGKKSELRSRMTGRRGAMEEALKKGGVLSNVDKKGF